MILIFFFIGFTNMITTSTEKLNTLTEEIISGRRLKKNDDISALTEAPTDLLSSCADRLRAHFWRELQILCTVRP